MLTRRLFIAIAGLLPFGAVPKSKPDDSKWKPLDNCPRWSFSGDTPMAGLSFDVFATVPVKTNEYGSLVIYEREIRIKLGDEIVDQFFLYGRCTNDVTSWWGRFLLEHGTKEAKKELKEPKTYNIDFNNWEAIERSLGRYQMKHFGSYPSNWGAHIWADPKQTHAQPV